MDFRRRRELRLRRVQQVPPLAGIAAGLGLRVRLMRLCDERAEPLAWPLDGEDEARQCRQIPDAQTEERTASEDDHGRRRPREQSETHHLDEERRARDEASVQTIDHETRHQTPDQRRRRRCAHDPRGPTRSERLRHERD